jgi:hypothetical protein
MSRFFPERVMTAKLRNLLPGAAPDAFLAK